MDWHLKKSNSNPGKPVTECGADPDRTVGAGNFPVMVDRHHLPAPPYDCSVWPIICPDCRRTVRDRDSEVAPF